MKYIKFIFIALILFLFSDFVYAVGCESISNEDAKAACAIIESYCNNGTQAKGCVYDENDPMYSEVQLFTNYTPGSTITIKNIPLTRGWMAAAKDGNMVFAGCYKGVLKHEYATRGNWDFTTFGDFFIFKIVVPKSNGNGCEVKVLDLYLTKGTTLNASFNLLAGEIGFGKVYNGTDAYGTVVDNYTFYEWISENDGNCPTLFGYTANIYPGILGTGIGGTSNKNRYLFSSVDVFDQTEGEIIPFDGEHYKNLGCTVQDKEGYEKAIKCYDEAINEINAKSCPSDLSDISTYHNTLDGIAHRCDNDLMVMYSLDLLKENAGKFKTHLSDAVNKKITSCQYSQCNLTDTQIDTLSNNLSTKTCFNGCNGLTGSEYDNCLSCLKGVFNSSGLSSSQINCLVETQKKKDESVERIEEEIEKEQEEHIESEIEESQEIRETLYEQYRQLTQRDPSIKIDPNEDMECREILGDNLTNIIHAAIIILQIAGAIIAIVKAMMVLIPPIISKDADALKSAQGTLINMAIILVIIFTFRPIIRLIGTMLNYDISCIL